MAEKYYVEVNGNGTFWYAWPGTERKLHRLGSPAIEYTDGYRVWYHNGQRHRLDGPALEYADGHREWYQNGQWHRLDGPAVELSDGYRAWFQNGQRHRIDGPAIEYAAGTKEWWLNGEQHTEESWRAATQPAVEMTVAEIEAALGKRVKVVK